MMQLIQPSRRVQSNNMLCHPAIVETDQDIKTTQHAPLTPRHSETQLTCSKSSLPPDSHESSITITPVTNTASKKHVRFEVPMDSERNVKSRLRDIFDEVDMMFVEGNDDNHDDTISMGVTSIDTSQSQSLYWNLNDLKKNRLYAQEKANVIRSKYPQEIEALESVIVDCCNRVNMTQPHRQVKENSYNIRQTEVTTMYNWSTSYVRGLEDYMTPLLSSNRRVVLQKIKRYETFLKKQDTCTLSEQQDRLCEFSRKLSAPARDFALKLAVGDALAASCDL